MVPGLVAPLSPREFSQLLQLQQGKSRPDPTGFKRFIMLGWSRRGRAASPSRSWAGNVCTPNLRLSLQTAVGRRFSGGKDVGASTGAALSPLCSSH